MDNQNEKGLVRTVCGMPDYLRCGLLVEIDDGVITKVRPASSSDPVGTGACPKGLATPDWAYHPDRLRYPMKRIGERGGGEWKRISWDEALDSIAAKLQELAKKYDSTFIS